MLVFKQEITSFISTNLEQPRAEWVSTSTYDYQIEVTYKNHVYRSIIDGNIGVTPSLNTGKWLLWSVDNSYAAIDMHSLTDSIMDDGLLHIEYTFAADGFNILLLMGVYALSVEILEYNITDTLLNTTTKSGIPTAGKESDTIDMTLQTINADTSYITVKIYKRTDGIAYISTMAGGEAFDIGAAQFGLEGGLIDFSLRETDKNGITSITKRNVKETMKASLVMNSSITQSVKKFIKSCMGDVVLFLADTSIDSNYENLTMIGYITDFSINIANPVKSYGSIEIEESL